MKVNPGKGHGEPSAEWVREKLRALRAVTPPESLGARLIAGIPPAAAGEPRIRRIRPWARGIHCGAVAAAVLIAGSVVVWLGTSWVGQGRPAVDANSSLSRAYASDYNSLHLSDINSCDINNPR